MDVDTLEPGVDFVERLHSAVGTADAVLVVIGRGWLNAKNLDGERRLDDPEDFVRLEVGLALTGAPVVIPVLVGGATMPSEDDLPPDLVPLARRNALTMIDADWRSGLARLVAALRRIVDPMPEPGETAAAHPSRAGGRGRVEPEPGPAPAQVPLLATALALVGAAGLLIGTFMQMDAWVDPTRRRRSRRARVLLELRADGPVVGALGALALSYSRSAGRIATGLFLGFALAGVARYVSLLGGLAPGQAGTTRASRGGRARARRVRSCSSPRPSCGCWPTARRAERRARPCRLGWWSRAPRSSSPGRSSPSTTARPRSKQLGDHRPQRGWGAVEPIGAALLAVGVAFLLGRRRSAASGALIGLGTFLVLLFAARYIGFPSWQPDTVSSVAEGGFVGLAGGAAILAGGLVARPRAGVRGWSMAEPRRRTPSRAGRRRPRRSRARTRRSSAWTGRSPGTTRRAASASTASRG